ncbi:phosphoribosylanthranilate isomerase [Flavobacterium supellecticarium]|uniref:N-(5'-phosphoribosyl)anthranilate isomerase n=1 Tax=Flavobacterium supellecticarium TaxID=2565924 RepID=A0A4S4A484_9FLAO|nr:phosphoribosylanthranilate isomerase [Flavobacterium supellecticarium]THF53279.1 phosphoribosylanthranilate isomerase [Flavobacterium supellecticarium]
MKYAENIAAIAALQPDYMGFIFYNKSARFYNDTLPEIPKTIKKTGVFVNADSTSILETIERYQLQAVQLHGLETPELCTVIRKESDVEIIKTFSIDTPFDFRKLDNYETVCDYYLFDTKGKLPGGNGFPFDWTLLENYPSSKPYFLSGGIAINHINTIPTTGLTPYAIDINSKFETAPGLKNITLCKQAIVTLKNN